MIKTCLKCSFENGDAAIDDLSECPKCGAIYSKVEAHVSKLAETRVRVQSEIGVRVGFR